MVQFKDLAQLQRYLQRGDIINAVFMDKNIEKVLAKEMSKAVRDVVYSKYAPKEYIRRGDDGGLSDMRNMHITKVEVVSGKVRVLFENLTMGQTHYSPIYEHDYDSMKGQFITDTIEDGIKENWYKQGVWSNARPFVQITIERIQANPIPLINAIKGAYKKIGFEVK